MKSHRTLVVAVLALGLAIPASARDLFYFLVGDSIHTYDFSGQYQHSFNLGSVGVHDAHRVALTTDGRTAWIGYNSEFKFIEGLPIRPGGISRSIPVDYSDWLFQGGLAQAGDTLILGRQRFPHPSYWPWYRLDYYSASSGALTDTCVSQGASDSLTWSDGRLAASDGSSGPLKVYVGECQVLRTINADLYPGNAITGICSTAGIIYVFYNVDSTRGHAFDWDGNRHPNLDIVFQGLAMPTDVCIAWGPDEMNLQVQPTALAYGDIIHGSSKTLPLRLRNVGNQDLTVSSIGLSNSTHFSYTGPTSAMIYVGGTLDIEVTCQPKAPGSLYSELVIASNDPDRPNWVVPLSAEGRPSTFFVDGSRATSGNGQSWATAFKNIPDALASVAVLNGAEIWVKEGTYILAQTITVNKSVALYGGFDGTETARNQRDWQNRATILDGNNAVAGLKTTAANVTFDGFKITRARNKVTTWPDYNGGGISILASGATIQNCAVSGCSVDGGSGGGIYVNYGISDVRIRNCRIEANSIPYDGAGICINSRNSEISDCVISGNSGRIGGGIQIASSPSQQLSIMIRNCIIQGNQASMQTGGIYNSWTDTIIQNCLVAGNTNGGIYNYVSTASITNCTVVDNTTYGIGTGYSDATPVITNCIVWGNTGSQIQNDSGANPTITYCDINQDGFGNVTNGEPDAKRNIRKAPRFVDADGPDNNPVTWQDNDYRLGNGSYGIDYGNGNVDPVTDLLGNPRYDDIGSVNLGTGDPVYVDLGCYERQTNTPLILYVDPAASGTQDGTHWANAFRTIAEALVASSPSGQVWIKEGPYVLTTGLVVNKPMRIYGGFVGTETDPAQRNLAGHTTTLDGNLTVSSCLKITANAALDGLTVTRSNGNADAPNDRGGAVYIDQASPTISRCRFIDNYARFGAGAVYAYKSAAVYINCVFLANRCGNGGGGGAAMYDYSSRTQFINCLFAANDSASNAGALYIQDETAAHVLINCTFAGNKAKYSGGAIYANRCSPVLTNCILSGNSANNQPDISGSPTVQYSLVSSTNYGGTNLTGDPRFADADGPDNDPATWQDNNYRLTSDSPCIDAGNNTVIPADFADLNGDTNTTERIPLDLSGTPRFLDHLVKPDTGLADPPAYPAVVDMGVYEYIPGDISGDGSVGIGDMPSIGDYWLSTDCGTCGGADLDSDHDVDLQDLLIMIQNWLVRPW